MYTIDTFIRPCVSLTHSTADLALTWLLSLQKYTQSRLFSRSGFSSFNAYPANNNAFPQSRSFGYGGEYNGIGSYNNGYYTGGYNGGYNGAGFYGGTNGLGGYSSGYNGNNGYYNNYPAYARYAPQYDQTSSFANSPPADVGLFSRISPVAPIYSGPGVSSSYSSSSSVHNGNGGGITFTESNVDGVRSGSTTQVDPSGRVTTYQHGTGTQDTLSTRMLQPGQGSGIYSASGVTNNNGNVSAFRAGGAIN